MKDFYSNGYLGAYTLVTPEGKRLFAIVIPSELIGIHYKAAIKKRNRWMVDQADKILAYIYRDFGGAFDTVKYAFRMGKPVLNLAPKG